MISEELLALQTRIRHIQIIDSKCVVDMHDRFLCKTHSSTILLSLLGTWSRSCRHPLGFQVAAILEDLGMKVVNQQHGLLQVDSFVVS